MALVTVLSPESDAEIVAVVAMLEAHEIPCYVHSAGLGGLFPGLQVEGFNSRAIMVPEEEVGLAMELLREYQSQPSEPDEAEQPKSSRKLRNVIEFLLFGWFIPGSRTRRSTRTLNDPAMSDVAAVEDLLAQVAAFAPREVGEIFELWVPDSLTYRGNLLAHDIAMAMVLDSLLAKELSPMGFDSERGGRRYRYRFEGQATGH